MNSGETNWVIVCKNMTEFVENLLTSMSTVFNSSRSRAQDDDCASAATVIDLNLNEDKTLKWRSHHKNQYAALKNRKKSTGKPQQNCQYNDCRNQHQYQHDFLPRPEEMKLTDKQSVNNIEKSVKSKKPFDEPVQPSTVSSVSYTLQRRLRRPGGISDIVTMKISNKSNSAGDGHKYKTLSSLKRRQKSSYSNQKHKTSHNFPSETRKLRRSERNTINADTLDKFALEVEPKTGFSRIDEHIQSGQNSIACKDSEIQKDQKMDDVICKQKRKNPRRSGRLEATEDKYVDNQKTNAMMFEVGFIAQSEKKELHLPESNNSVIFESSRSEDKQQINEKTPKRRGRRPKNAVNKILHISEQPSSTVCRKLSRPPKEVADCILSNAIMRKDIPHVALPSSHCQRPMRRIKPTMKILENEELRYEFESKNIARLASASEILNERKNRQNNNFAIVDFKCESKEQAYEIKNEQIALSGSTTSPMSVSQELTRHLDGEKVVSTEKSSLNVDNIYRTPPQKRCPDPQVFLNEIKAAKLNLHKSPEDKKLNRKQHRKLLKQKEKHLEKLGLQRNSQNFPSESDSCSESGGEDFIPPKKVRVGKPNITLRVRSNKDGSPSVEARSESASCYFKEKFRSKPKIRSRLLRPTIKRSSRATEVELLNPEPDLLPVIKSEPSSFICFCNKSSQYYAQKSIKAAICCAIDTIEEQKVGCCNSLNSELVNLFRPSEGVGYMILCNDHKKRLRAHNCCAVCGVFCTQGRFVLCQQRHFFHAECAQKFILNTPYDPGNVEKSYTSPTLVLKCPHCGHDTPSKTSKITMKCRTLPIFLPNPKTFIKPAKMALPCSSSASICSTSSKNTLYEQERQKLRAFTELEVLIPESVMNIASRPKADDSSEYTTKDLFYSINNDDLERVAEIIGSGFDLRTEMPEFLNGTCLHQVAHFGTLQMAYLLLSRDSSEEFINTIDKELRTAAMCAIIGEKYDIFKLFIECGAELSIKGSDGMTCLHIAAKSGNLLATKLIVERFKSTASIFRIEKFINTTDDGGWTAIVWAAENGHTEIVSFLITHGANLNICDTENNTVLHWATISNRLETVMVLLEAKCSPSMQNVNGDTPLHIACRQSSTRICLMLIANSADIMVKNRAQELPYDCIPDEESQCARAVGFNMQMRSVGQMGLKARIVCSDVSNGRESFPMQVVRRSNTNRMRDGIEDEVLLPEFKYITRSIVLQNSIQIDQRISQMRVCSCNDGCSSDQCQCSTMSVQNWYNPEGRLNGEFNYDDPAMIFECNDVCGCNKLICRNRVVQNGIRAPLQVFECDQILKGWGVRSVAQIPKGSFVAEYMGEILTDSEADRRTDDSYFFDLGASQHCIDANYYGNISRFFNHSCSPNIVPVRVYFDHQDFRFPKIAFFACQDIAAREEIVFDYGEKFWAVKQTYFDCQCGVEACRYSRKRRVMPPSSTNDYGEVLEQRCLY